MEVAELFLLESHRFACSGVCQNVEFANRSHNCRDFVGGQGLSPAGTLKKLASFSTHALKAVFSFTLVHPKKFSSACCRQHSHKYSSRLSSPLLLPFCSQRFEISDFENTECRADVRSAVDPAQTITLIDSDHIEKLRAMVPEAGK